MRVDIQSVSFNADQKLLDYTTNRVEKLDKYFDAIVAAKVFLKLEKSDTKENKVVEIRLEVPGPDLFVTKNSNTFEAATDEACDALSRQIKKMKDKMRNR